MVNDKIEVLLNLKTAVQKRLNNCDGRDDFDYGYSCGMKDVISLIDAQVNEIMNDIAVGMEK